MKNKGFTLIETAILMLITTILLSTGLTITNFSKSFLKFQEEKFLLGDNLRKSQDLSFRSIELPYSLFNATTTICGVGIVIGPDTLSYKMIGYATTSPDELVDCYEIASNTPKVFDFSSKDPELYYLKTNEFSKDQNHIFLIKKELKNIKVKFKKDDSEFYGKTSIMFVHPYGDLIVYNNGNEVITSTTAFKNFYIILNSTNEYATITLTNTGQILSE